MNENEINNDIQIFDDKNSEQHEIDLKRINYIKKIGFWRSLLSNVYSIFFIVTLTYILVGVFKNSTSGSSGSGWGFVFFFFIIICGPVQIASLVTSGLAISNYEECEKQNIKLSTFRNVMHWLNIVNILFAFLVICIPVISMFFK